MGSTKSKNDTTMISQYTLGQSLDALLSWLFGIVMLAAAIPHWENSYYFLGSVYAYKLVEPGVGQMTAMIMPLLQLFIAILLIARIYIEVIHLITMILFGVFFTVQLYAYLGSLDISCGCFGPQHSSQIGIVTLTFVGTLFVLAVVRFVCCRISVQSACKFQK
jgi:hypothetical protein